MNTKPVTSIDAYIAQQPNDRQPVLNKMRQAISSAAPGSTEDIRYQMPTFRLHDKNLVHFAAWKNHVGFYPTPGPIKVFKKELAKYGQSKGAIQFPIDKPLPLALIKKIVRYRVKELNSKL